MRRRLATLAAVMVLAVGGPAVAAPKGAAAKAAFERGVVAYQKGDFKAASAALETSFKLEADVETLFAWAQSERQLESCDRAIELFTKLLGFDMPAENKQVVQGKIDECKAILAAKSPPKDATPPPKDATPPPKDATPPPKDVTPPKDTGPKQPTGSPWWKDPIGDGLVGLGIIGVAVGGFYLKSASSAEQDSKRPGIQYEEFAKLDDKATKNGKLGVTASIAGGVLIIGGVVRYITRGGGKEQRTVTGWLAPGGGGIAAIGRF